MDALSLILTALTSGATASIKDTASQAIKDSYEGLKALIQHKFAEQPKAQAALVEYEEDPETYDKPLRKALTSYEIDQDETVIEAAKQLLALTQNQQAVIGHTVLQNYGTVQGQVGENTGSITMNFGETPKPER